MQSLQGHTKDVGFYHECDGKLQKGFVQGKVLRK